MLFRYDFGEKLDLTKFEIQSKHYIGQIRQLQYHLVLPHYKLIIDIDTPDDTTSHIVTSKITALKRDKDGEIESEIHITPANDVRFQDFKIIKTVWNNPFNVDGGWYSNSAAFTTDRIISILKIVHKINNLRAFI
jgi:hypothetical protein